MPRILFWFLPVLIILGLSRVGAVPVEKLSNWLTPIQRESYRLAYNAWQGFGLLRTLPLVFRENRDLRLRLLDLEYLKVENENLKKENEALLQQLEAPAKHRFKLLPAHLLGGQSLGDNFLLLIDQGLDDGVREGMAVIFQKILIGKVKEAFAHQSLVLPVFSNKSKVPAKLANAAKGMVVGELNSRVRLAEVPLEAALEIDEPVVSSGDGGTYPSNLLIGKIAKVFRQENKIFQEAILALSWDLKDLEMVFVVLN